jgi:hypothetical protein
VTVLESSEDSSPGVATPAIVVFRVADGLGSTGAVSIARTIDKVEDAAIVPPRGRAAL